MKEGQGGEAKGDFQAVIHHGKSGLRGARRMVRQSLPFPVFSRLGLVRWGW